jgi:hypothetical protein
MTRSIQHRGFIFPRRTCAGAPVSYENTHGKWAATFQTWVGVPGEEHLVNEITSGALFDSEDEAYEASTRALDVLEATGMFPNLCEKF